MSYREPAVRSLPLYVTFNGRVAALDSETGKVMWSHVMDTMVTSTLLADDVRLYVLTSVALTAVEGETGRGVWRTALPFDSRTTAWEIARHGERILVTGAGRVYAYSRFDGTLVWEARAASLTIPAP